MTGSHTTPAGGPVPGASLRPSPASPSLSVLVPCWNAEATIGRALASVLDEPGLDLECIVVDDASTDGTVAAVAAIAARDPRVVLLALPENRGVSNARNEGLARVRGEWLTLLDADDRFTAGGLGRLFEATRHADALAVVGQQVWSDGSRTWIGPLYDIPDIRQPGRKSIARHPGLLYYVSPHAKLFHRSVVDGLRFEGRVLGDQPWVVRALLRSGDRIEVLGETVYEWIRTSPAGAASITASTRSSARRGVEAAQVAEGALGAVAEETERQLSDPGERARVLETYVERLLRSDLAAHLGNALRRRDPTLDELLGAIRRFVERVPPEWIAPSNGLARDIVEPPLRHWHRVPAPARGAVWSLVASAFTAQPNLPAHGSDPLARLLLRFVRPGSPALARGVAVALLTAATAVRAAVRRVRRLLPG